MRKFVIASHGKMAEGIMDSVNMILGEQEDVECYSAFTLPGEVLKDRIEEILNAYSEDDEIIVVVDIMGGSVCNEFVCQLHRKNLHIIAGMNLPLLLEMFSHRDAPLDEMINIAVNTGSLSVIYCNDSIGDIDNECF